MSEEGKEEAFKISNNQKERWKKISVFGIEKMIRLKW